MWSLSAQAKSHRPVRGGWAKLVGALAIMTTLGGCSLVPVYGTSGDQTPAIAYAQPTTRDAQIAYQTLSAHLPPSRDPQAPLLSLTVTLQSADIGRVQTIGPVTERQITAHLAYTLARDETIILEDRQSATSDFHETGQIIADDAARRNAEEHAIRAAAERARLALIAALARP